MHELLMRVTGMRLKSDFLAEVFVLLCMVNELVPSPQTESRLFTFARPFCVTCLSLFKFYANRHVTRIK